MRSSAFFEFFSFDVLQAHMKSETSKKVLYIYVFRTRSMSLRISLSESSDFFQIFQKRNCADAACTTRTSKGFFYHTSNTTFVLALYRKKFVTMMEEYINWNEIVCLQINATATNKTLITSNVRKNGCYVWLLTHQGTERRKSVLFNAAEFTVKNDL